MSNQRDFPARYIPQLNAMIRAILEHETLEHPFWVSGYVTRHFLSDSGHLYFDITDDDFSISCMLRDKVRSTIGFDIGNGMDLAVLGSIRVYERRAQIQIDVEAVRQLNNPESSVDVSLLQQLEKKGFGHVRKSQYLNLSSELGLSQANRVRHSMTLKTLTALMEEQLLSNFLMSDYKATKPYTT